MNGDEKEVKVNGLMDDNQDAEMTKEKEEEMRSGPKIGNDVQVKICDMGNGCWTYHHFTPEIQTR